MIRLRRLEHSYLHELFKAVILYDAPEVKKMLAKRIGGKLMKEWTLIISYQEISPKTEEERYNGNADVLWILRAPKSVSPDDSGRRPIVHEVKTGKYDIAETIIKYRKTHYEGGRYRTTLPDHPLYLWGWKKYSDKKNIRGGEISFSTKSGSGRWYEHTFDVEKTIKRGGVRLLPLDWLLPILEERMSEVFEWLN